MAATAVGVTMVMGATSDNAALAACAGCASHGVNSGSSDTRTGGGEAKDTMAEGLITSKK
jgi:hypothetical protein